MPQLFLFKNNLILQNRSIKATIENKIFDLDCAHFWPIKLPVWASIGRNRNDVINDVIPRRSYESNELISRWVVEEERRNFERRCHDPASVVADRRARVQVVGRRLAQRIVGLDFFGGIEF